MTSEPVVVGSAADTTFYYTVTLNRLPADTTADLTTITEAHLTLPDGSHKALALVSKVVDQWVGRVRYNAWWTLPGAYPTFAGATFADSSIGTWADPLVFNVIAP